ncbi:MAG: hypothetical protein RLZZ347_157 [Candidatus Parcubacteria bacterium]|jgi:hypothetical protein
MKLILTCDKCGCTVPPTNDVAVLLALMDEGLVTAVLMQSRHFLPVIGPNGEVVCPGSPSRAQYIDGQPRDSRNEYPYDSLREIEFRRAYQKMLTGDLAE